MLDGPRFSPEKLTPGYPANRPLYSLPLLYGQQGLVPPGRVEANSRLIGYSPDRVRLPPHNPSVLPSIIAASPLNLNSLSFLNPSFRTASQESIHTLVVAFRVRSIVYRGVKTVIVRRSDVDGPVILPISGINGKPHGFSSSLLT
ncbi:MAG: hypothetical protein DDT19_02132 [Syntrophomonadaceae bacterium]|nr:hypothetical protein [Bacillota bacterium]